MEKIKPEVIADARRALQSTWTCSGDDLQEWVCADGRALNDHSKKEVAEIARELEHRAGLHEKRARRLLRAAKTIVRPAR
jgi:hypothetical protein